MPENEMTTEELARELDILDAFFTHEQMLHIEADVVRRSAARLRELDARNKVLEEVRAHYADHGQWSDWGDKFVIRCLYRPATHGWNVAEKAGAK